MIMRCVIHGILLTGSVACATRDAVEDLRKAEILEKEVLRKGTKLIMLAKKL
jgi:hypothetical protein